MTRIYTTPEEHLRHFPRARTTTLAWISARRSKTEQLRRELATGYQRNETRLNREPRRNVLQVIKRLVGWA